ncbi:hypothetical protein [Embleya sp. NBC_00896]|uniref:hypothetical protein n=1 Tax=Embleya sp. NBC_00896 TaxID=2975961 RepID=UPI002F90CF2B|nr:hypothetical protein OG928_48645 [Embleya sp. NBC_00896]
MGFSPPPVPLALADLPRTRAGLVVPAISLRHRDGTAILGMTDHDRVHHALSRGLCQTCWRPLDDRIVALARPRDFVHGWISEPGMHPVCAHYSTQGCPMLAGVLTRHRATPRASVREPCGDPECHCVAWAPVDPHGPRAKAPAESWYTIWLAPDSYHVGLDPTTQRLALDLSRARPLKIRPLSATGATREQADGYRAMLSTRAFLADLCAETKP